MPYLCNLTWGNNSFLCGIFRDMLCVASFQYVISLHPCGGTCFINKINGLIGKLTTFKNMRTHQHVYANMYWLELDC